MNSEKSCVYEIETQVADLNEQGVLKPHAYQRLFAQLADRHLKEIEVDVHTTMKSGLAWALASLSIEIAGPVAGCAKLFASTWYSQRRGPIFRRELVFRNRGGDVLFQGSTFSVLLDVEKRSIYRIRELPFFLGEPIEEFTIEARPSNKTSLEFHKVNERKVYNSYIDLLGHVNNCRYGEFAYDSFTDEERENLIELKRIDIYFLSELRSKDSFSVLKAYEGNRILVRGHNDTRGVTAFDIVFGF